MEIKLIKLVNLIFSKNLSSSKLFVRQKEPDIEKNSYENITSFNDEKKGLENVIPAFFCYTYAKRKESLCHLNRIFLGRSGWCLSAWYRLVFRNHRVVMSSAKLFWTVLLKCVFMLRQVGRCQLM